MEDMEEEKLEVNPIIDTQAVVTDKGRVSNCDPWPKSITRVTRLFGVWEKGSLWGKKKTCLFPLRPVWL